MQAVAGRAQAKRDQIAAAARTLFLSGGFARTSMAAVTAEAGVSKQTLYAYFPGKIELLRAIVEDELSSLRPTAAARPPAASVAELRETLLSLARGITHRLMDPDVMALLRLLVGEAVHLPEIRHVFRQAIPAQLLSMVEAVLIDAGRAGLVQVPRPELSARMFVGPVMSFVALDGLFSLEGGSPPDEDTLDFVVDAFLHSLTSREPS
ncbi:MAG: TetR/AcrR family transcriptional regulator [Micropruina sp.]